MGRRSNPTRRWWKNGTVTVVLLAVWVPVASAHIQVVHGRLVDAIQQSDLVLIGTIEDTKPLTTRSSESTIVVDRVVLGHITVSRLRVRGANRLVPGQRHALFLRRHGDTLHSVAPSGTLFPASPQDDETYRHAVETIHQALGADASTRIFALRSALIPVLSAPVSPLRYYAALDLISVDHGEHGLRADERAALQRLLSDPSTDPTLRPLLAGYLATTLR